jgi:predicted nucleic acid-binding protein
MLQKEEPAATRVIELLGEAQGERVKLAISVINLGEVVYRVGKVSGESAAWETLAELQRLPMDVLSVEDDLVWRAAGWKMRHTLSYADAFAAAAAERLGAVLVTGDPELTRLTEGVRIERLTRTRR